MKQVSDKFITPYLVAIEDELQQAISQAKLPGDTMLRDMLAYHMGWQDNPAKSEGRGKRLRPLLVLLTCSAAGGEWRSALPAAAAVELVHNFSLIHDDIEDQSPVRRGRPTLWKKWGIPQAINAGDAMFTLAHLQPIRLAETLSQSAALKAVDILQQTCLHLTMGQYLDLAYEQRKEVSMDDYWSMVGGKTAALISASTELGALSALCDEKICQSYRNFGRIIGLAFQVQDDYLGIWGNSLATGKSNQSDLINHKKTLPILFSLAKNEKFSTLWNRGQIQISEVDELIGLLETEGAKEFTQSEAQSLVTNALGMLEALHPQGKAGEVIKEMTLNLINRQE